VPIVQYLFFPPGPTGAVFDRWGGVLFGAFVALALGISLLSAVMYEVSARHVLNRRVARQIFFWGVGLQLLGLVLLGLRLVNWPILSMRILLYAFLIAEVYAAGYLWWWIKTRYPARLAAYEWEEKKRAYLPRASGGTLEPARRRTAARRRR
jgi:hypothetical protein